MRGLRPHGSSWRWLVVALTALSPLDPAVRGDTVLLRGGEKLVGRVLSENADSVSFESRSVGQVRIPRGTIEKLEREPRTASPMRQETPGLQVPPVSPAATSVAVDDGGASQGPFYPWVGAQGRVVGYDWIQLKSGEWLGGRLKSLLEDKVEFDSDKLNLLTFDWKDIYVLRSGPMKNVWIENHTPVDGSILVTTNEVRLATATGTNTYPRASLLSVAPTGNREWDKWTAKLSAGVSFRSGNTREEEFNTHVTVDRRTSESRAHADYVGNYGRVNGSQTEQNHRLAGQYDIFLSRRFYIRVPDAELYRDPLQNLDSRLTLGAGVGYDLLKRARTEWNVTVSPSWQRNWYTPVAAGQGSTADSVAMVLATRFDTELTERLDWVFEYRGQLTGRESGDNLHHLMTTLEFEIRKRLKLDLSLSWDRIARPRSSDDSTTPTPDDVRLITSLGVEF